VGDMSLTECCSAGNGNSCRQGKGEEPRNTRPTRKGSATFQARLCRCGGGRGATGRNCQPMILLQLRQERHVYSFANHRHYFFQLRRSGTVGQAGEVGTCFEIKLGDAMRRTLPRLHRRLPSCRPAGALDALWDGNYKHAAPLALKESRRNWGGMSGVQCLWMLGGSVLSICRPRPPTNT